MGYMRHNAIVVTSWKGQAITEASALARRFGLQVIGPSDEVVNGYRTLLVCPDGSKEGWIESNAGDDARKHFKKWLDEQRFEDGSTSLEWAEIAYGSDDKNAEIIAHAWVGA